MKFKYFPHQFENDLRKMHTYLNVLTLNFGNIYPRCYIFMYSVNIKIALLKSIDYRLIFFFPVPITIISKYHISNPFSQNFDFLNCSKDNSWKSQPLFPLLNPPGRPGYLYHWLPSARGLRRFNNSHYPTRRICGRYLLHAVLSRQ